MNNDIKLLQKGEYIDFLNFEIEAGNYSTFEATNNSMNGGRLYDIPKGALVFGKEIGHDYLLKEGVISGAKSGFVINWKGRYLHLDITPFNNQEPNILCTSRNPKFYQEKIILNLEEVEQIFEIIARQF